MGVRTMLASSIQSGISGNDLKSARFALKNRSSDFIPDMSRFGTFSNGVSISVNFSNRWPETAEISFKNTHALISSASKGKRSRPFKFSTPHPLNTKCRNGGSPICPSSRIKRPSRCREDNFRHEATPVRSWIFCPVIRRLSSSGIFLKKGNSVRPFPNTLSCFSVMDSSRTIFFTLSLQYICKEIILFALFSGVIFMDSPDISMDRLPSLYSILCTSASPFSPTISFISLNGSASSQNTGATRTHKQRKTAKNVRMA